MNLTLNLALWIAAGLLAVVFLLSSAIKLFVPKEKLAATPGGGWTGDASVGFVKAIAALELLAAAGLILPATIGIAPVLVPLAAVGVMLLMVGAMITHLRRHEAMFAVLNLAYLALAAFVAWGRLGPEPLTG
jgi:DoxX-like family